MKRAMMFGAAAVLLSAGAANAGMIDPRLDATLRDAAPDEIVSVLAYMAVQEDLDAITGHMDEQRASLRERHEVVVRALRDVASATQVDLLAHLDELKAAKRIDDFKSFWITNMVRIDATPAEIRLLAERDDLDIVYPNYGIELIAPVEELGGVVGAADGGPEPGVVAVRAPEVWAMGITGEGVLVATLDTGVDGNHPALASRWRGVADPRYADNPEWAWFDLVDKDSDFPYADGSHGTHTMGSVCGGAPGDQVGVAPGAQWIHGATIDRSGGGGIPGTVADSIAAFQWMVDPDGDPATNWDVPASCSNSWGLVTSHGYPSCDETFWSFIDACEAAGVVVIFSAGNEGSGGLRRPADRAWNEYDSMAVASVNANISGWPISGFSSRGPTNCTPNGSAAIKPDISAPGESVRSSVPGGYGNSSGTSMASPHINGVVALMRQANPDISVDDIKQVIYDTAFDLGPGGEDNSYGYGMVDAFEAVQTVITGLIFDFPDGRPELIDPAGGTTVRVVVTGTAGDVPEPGTGLLYYSADGAPYTAVAMNEVSDNVYDAVFPTFSCGADVNYYFSAETTDGELALNPRAAPDAFYSGDVYTSIEVAFVDDFEADTGWTVESFNLTAGEWERGVPAGAGDRGDPSADADGSGNCYLTDNRPGDSDVDGGPTVLTSPPLDATGLADAGVSYARWFYNDDGDEDRLDVEISDDDGATWTLIESVGGGGGWVTVSHRISDYVTPTDRIRLRFSATDNPNDSVTEAGVDAVRITGILCKGGGNPGDADGDGDADFEDVLAVLKAWGPCGGCPEDLDGDGFVTFQDLLLVLGNWTG